MQDLEHKHERDHGDHAAWLEDIATWRSDLAKARAELTRALKRVADHEAELDLHEQTIRDHEAHMATADGALAKGEPVDEATEAYDSRRHHQMEDAHGRFQSWHDSLASEVVSVSRIADLEP